MAALRRTNDLASRRYALSNIPLRSGSVPVNSAVELTACITERTPRKTRVECTVIAGGELCARAEVLAIRVVEKPEALVRGSAA